jgi:hypothetical protein
MCDILFLLESFSDEANLRPILICLDLKEFSMYIVHGFLLGHQHHTIPS